MSHSRTLLRLLPRSTLARRTFTTTRPVFVNVGDPIPDIELVEGSPGNKVNLAKELKGKGLVIGVPAAFSTCYPTPYIQVPKTCASRQRAFALSSCISSLEPCFMFLLLLREDSCTSLTGNVIWTHRCDSVWSNCAFWWLMYTSLHSSKRLDWMEYSTDLSDCFSFLSVLDRQTLTL